MKFRANAALSLNTRRVLCQRVVEEQRALTGAPHTAAKRTRGYHRQTFSRRWEFVHIAIDDCTRPAYVDVLDDEKARTAIGLLRRAIAFS